MEERQLNVYQRVLAVMEDLDYIQKGDKRVNNQYRFVSHDQVTAAIHPLLVKHRLLILPHTKEIKQDGNRTEVTLQLSFVNPDSNPVEIFCLDFVGYGIDTGDKGPGKAISYAYKYGALKVFCLETGDDPDKDQDARYEPVKCLDFDFKLPSDMDSETTKKMHEFLSYTAEAANTDIEKVKQEASKQMDKFLAAFNRWSLKK